MESNQDPDFAEDEGIYDELNLEEAEIFGFSNEDEDNQGSTLDSVNDLSPSSPVKKEAESTTPPEQDQDSPKRTSLKDEEVII